MRKARLWILLLVIVAAGILPAQAQSDAACNLDTQEAYIQRGNRERSNSQYDKAAADYSCALALNNGNLDALFGRAYTYYAMGEATQAEADYTQYIQLNPNEASAYNNRGNIYYDRGDYTRARLDYDKAIGLPYDEKYIPYYNRGNLNYQTGDYKAAVSDLSEALNLNASDSLSYLLRAGVYQAMGDSAALKDILEYVNLIRRVSGSEKADDLTKGKTLMLAEGTVFTVPVSLTQGQEIRAAASAPADSKADPLLVLLDASGKAVAWDDDSGVNLDAVMRYTAAASGDYSLLITHAAGGSAGTVSVALSITGEGAAPSAETNAEAFRVYELVVNDRATVFASEGDRLNLRSGPGLSFDILSKLTPDTYVTLLEGPRKNDGYNWWRISTDDGREGWAVERVTEEQTLYPALKSGDTAVVTLKTPGDTLRMREGAGRSFAIVTQLPAGTLLTLLEGPQVVDDLSWWKVRTADGVEGWTVERVGDERTLQPADSANG